MISKEIITVNNLFASLSVFNFGCHSLFIGVYYHIKQIWGSMPFSNRFYSNFRKTMSRVEQSPKHNPCDIVFEKVFSSKKFLA